MIALGGLGHAADWREKLAKELPLLGHRNWVVIADSAYPAQSRAGIETIATETDQLNVVRAVLAALDKSRHVRPVIFTDAELKHVPEEDAKGITSYREELAKLLARVDVAAVPHEELIGRLDKAGDRFRIIVLKTNMTLPYTSVFIQLDCGYWSPEAEKKLRETMKAKVEK
jgi:D-ribose pyranose/furanose isomerase RbsD